MDEVIIKFADNNVFKELNELGFDKSYINSAVKKYMGNTYKLFQLRPYEANILKQICLSLGFDCAVSRESVMCSCEYTDAVIFANNSQIEKLILKLRKQPFRLNKIAESFDKIINLKLKELEIRSTVFDWQRPYIMGILNVTPDSFSDGGRYFDLNSAIKHAEEMIKDGADIIDIGGESIRPGAQNISPQTEIERVIPVIKELRKINENIPISIDTRNYETAISAFDAGADIINDVSGLKSDNKLAEFIKNNDLPAVIMHSDTVPANSSDFTSSDITDSIYIDLFNRLNDLVSLGLNKNKLIIDAGIGFGKSADSSFQILKRINEFNSLGCPILLGISRKSFLKNTFNVDEKDLDTLTALYSSMLKSVNIHRVHNVALTKKYIDYAQKLY